MDARPDTSSSGRFRGQWSFLANHVHHAQRPNSHSPSSYIHHSDRSNLSPLPAVLHHQAASGSRASQSRNLTTASIGGRTCASIPSQPVLIRIHSADASAHTNPAPRPRRPIKMNKSNTLPAISEFSLQGILAAIHEDVEADINTISEILGRSRLVLADQHDSHMPPLGEIRAPSSLLESVDENEGAFADLPPDDVLILREDASLIDGSQAGSAAYGLLERLQALPRTSRGHSDWPVSRPTDQILPSSPSQPLPPPSNVRTFSSPAALDVHASSLQPSTIAHYRQARNLLQQATVSTTTTSRATNAMVSETRLSASVAGGVSQTFTDPGALESHRTHDLYTDSLAEHLSADHPHSNNANNIDPRTSIRERMQSLLYVSDPTGLTKWLQHDPDHHDTPAQTHSAESQLRDLLERHDNVVL